MITARINHQAPTSNNVCTNTNSYIILMSCHYTIGFAQKLRIGFVPIKIISVLQEETTALGTPLKKINYIPKINRCFPATELCRPKNWWFKERKTKSTFSTWFNHNNLQWLQNLWLIDNVFPCLEDELLYSWINFSRSASVLAFSCISWKMSGILVLSLVFNVSVTEQILCYNLFHKILKSDIKMKTILHFAIISANISTKDYSIKQSRCLRRVCTVCFLVFIWSWCFY